MYFGPPFYGSTLNCHFVYLTLPGTLYHDKAKSVSFAKSKILICSNKHETDLVYAHMWAEKSLKIACILVLYI